jgi:hypothetical protein
MVRKTATLALFAGLVLSGRHSYAQTQQPWLADRRYGEGAGVRSGNLELHPGVALEAGYDSNFFQAAGADPNPLVSEPIIPVARLRLTPSLSLRTLGPERREQDGATAAAPKANFELGTALRVDKLFSLKGPGGTEADSTLIGGDVGAEVEVGPGEPVATLIGGSFSRVAHPTNDPAEIGAGLNHNQFGGHLDIRWRPGGGILSWTIGYAGSVVQFDNQEYALDRAEHGFRTLGRYRFLPRTALLYEGQVGFVSQLSRDSRLANAAPISSQLGINGLVTTRFSVLMMAGFKAMFFEPTPSGSVDDFNGVVGRGEVTWYTGGAAPDMDGPEDRGLSHVRLGVQRDVQPGGIGNFYQLNRGFLEATMSAAGVVVVTAEAGYSLVVHAPPRDTDGQPLSSTGGKVVENRIDAGLYAEYRLVPTFALLGNLEFSSSQPDNYVIVDTTRFLQDNLKYNRFTALVGARWFL